MTTSMSSAVAGISWPARSRSAMAWRKTKPKSKWPSGNARRPTLGSRSNGWSRLGADVGLRSQLDLLTSLNMTRIPMSMRFVLKSAAVAATVLLLSAAQAATITKADYQASKTRISADYKADKAACASLAANAKDICVEEAKAKEKVARAELEYSFTGKAKDRNKALVAKAESTYAVAKEKCDDKAGNDKDVCVKAAKTKFGKN